MTGSVENALLVDGRLSKLSEELAWEYDPEDWMAPWRVRGDAVDLTFTPELIRASGAEHKAAPSQSNQCFGSWSGSVRDEGGARVEVADVFGWAQARNP